MQMNWQETFFRGVALDAWRRVATPEMTSADVTFLERALAVKDGAALLDVPCGNGRHSIELSERGYRMTGLDLSEEFIEEASTSAPQGIRWARGDMRDITWDSEFDGAFCFGNSFGYFNWEEARRFLTAVARALK